MHSPFNPLTTALQNTFASNPEIQVVDYHRCFSELWRAGLQGHPAEGVTTIIICGTTPPNEAIASFTKREVTADINFSDHLTAYSWVAAWRLKFPEARTRIIVIETLRATNSVARAIATLFRARQEDGTALVPGITVLQSPSLADVFKVVGLSKHGAGAMSQTVQTMLRTIIWDALTSNRDGHHAASNVLGAFLLSAQAGQREASSQLPCVQEYLLTLVQICFAGANAGKSQSKTSAGFERSANRALEIEIEQIVLIDDMADLWEGFLRKELDFARDDKQSDTSRSDRSRAIDDRLVSIESTLFSQTMLSLPERLSEVLKTDRRCLTPNDLIPGKAQSNNEFVLFLDLRLFSVDDTHTVNQFYANMIAFGRQLLAQKHRPLPWLDGGAFIEFERELDGDEIGGHPRETLLPRILSLLDPTLPIVIFSSTHRSELIDPFRNYGNIITTFRKPMLSSLNQDWNTIVNEARQDLYTALQSAANILRVRRKLSGLIIPETLPPVSASRHKRFIEIYIDESGNQFNDRDPGFAVGGIILAHESKAAQKSFHRAINESPRKWGVSDLLRDRIQDDDIDAKVPNLSYFPKKPKPNGQDEADGLNLVAAALGDKSQLAAFALIDPGGLRFTRDNRLNSAILFDRNSLDNIYHTLLARTLETLLFEHPWVDLKTDSLFIHVATRQQIIDDEQTTKIWKEAYGIEFRERGQDGRPFWQYTSLDMDAVYPVIRQILQRRSALPNQPDIVMARGVTLNDYEDIVRSWRVNGRTPRIEGQLHTPRRLDPKQIHYLADWVVRMALYRKADEASHLTRESPKMPSLVKSWFSAGYIQSITEEFVALSDACSFAKPGEAIRHVSRISLSPWNLIETSFKAERYLRKSASTWPNQLTGDDLRTLFRESAPTGGTQPDQTPTARLPGAKSGPPTPPAAPARYVLATPASPAVSAKGIAIPNRPVRWRVLITIPLQNGKDGVQQILQSNTALPKPMAVRVFESQEKEEFIFDLMSADDVCKFLATRFEIGGTTIRAMDVTLPTVYRMMHSDC